MHHINVTASGCDCYNENTIPYQQSSMTIKELLLQEIENTPDELLDDLLVFLKSLKATPDNRAATYVGLLERIDYLEAIVGIRTRIRRISSWRRYRCRCSTRALTA